nr:reverse transcriptase domain-containing protein [Tanacetum cinerariifolium]
MMAIFYDMIEKTKEVSMDDFFVFRNSLQRCPSYLERMLKRYEDTNLCLNWEKSHFMVKECIVLGHKFSKQGIEVDKAKVDVITKVPHPTTVKGIRSFLGHAGFYRRFIKDISKIARPMTRLLEKDTPFIFSQECVEVFQTLKRKLTEAPILIALDWDMPFELMCDASDFTIGAVLGQRQDKHFRPTLYASKTMTEAESNYTTTEKEMLAVVYAFEKFWSYLILNKSIVYTDHFALKYMFAKKDSKSSEGVYLARKLLKFSKLATMDQQEVTMAQITQPERVLLFTSRLNIFSDKLKSRWSGPFKISQVYPYITVEMSQPDGPNFKVNGHRLKHYFGEDVPNIPGNLKTHAEGFCPSVFIFSALIKESNEYDKKGTKSKQNWTKRAQNEKRGKVNSQKSIKYLAFTAAVAHEVADLLPTLIARITDEIRQNENNGNNGNRRNSRRGNPGGSGNDGDAQPTDIHVWLERMRDQFKARLETYKLEVFSILEERKCEREYKSIHQLVKETSTDFMKRFLRLASFLGAKAAQVANATRNIEIFRDQSKNEGDNKRDRDGHRIRPSETPSHRFNPRAYDRRDSDRYGNHGRHDNRDRYGTNKWRGDRQSSDRHGNGSNRQGNGSQKAWHNQDQQVQGQHYSRSYRSSNQSGYPDYNSCPPCNLYRKFHPEKACHRATSACFECGEVGHLAKDCKKGSVWMHPRNHVNNEADPAFTALVAQAVADLLPTLTARITDEIRQNENNGNNEKTPEDHSYQIRALNVDSLKVDSVVTQNPCSETEDSNSETGSSKSVKESSLNSATKDVYAIKYKMSKAKERCMTYFRSLHSHLQVLSKKDLKGTHIEHGVKRAFMSLFGQDADTFTSTMLLNVDHLQKQLDKAEFQEDGSMTAFYGVNNQFQKFIDSQVTLDYDSQMTEKYFVEYTRIEVKHFRDTQPISEVYRFTGYFRL